MWPYVKDLSSVYKWINSILTTVPLWLYLIHIFEVDFGCSEHWEMKVSCLYHTLRPETPAQTSTGAAVLGVSQDMGDFKEPGWGNAEHYQVLWSTALDAVKCCELWFKLYILMGNGSGLYYWVSPAVKVVSHEPLLSCACHLGVVKVAGWCSPHRTVKTTWIDLTQREWLHHQYQDGFPGGRPIPCAPAAPALVVVEAMGNWTL